jgi:hypothetical protein
MNCSTLRASVSVHLSFLCISVISEKTSNCVTAASLLLLAYAPCAETVSLPSLAVSTVNILLVSLYAVSRSTIPVVLIYIKETYFT